jgi:hypothetical protein
MGWLKLAGLALQLALWLISWVQRQKAISEGEANVLRDIVEKSNELIERSSRARDSVSSDPASSVLDEFNRDEKSPGGSVSPPDDMQDDVSRKV